MQVSLGLPSEVDEIYAMVVACVAHLLKNDIYQWNENYPTKNAILNDLNNQDLYIIRHNISCIAMIVINEFQDKEWEVARWSDNYYRPLIIHRLIVDPGWQRKGVGRALMDFAIKYAAENNYDSIRFDVYSGNPGLIKTYERMGCVKRGEVVFPHRELPFYCYEIGV